MHTFTVDDPTQHASINLCRCVFLLTGNLQIIFSGLLCLVKCICVFAWCVCSCFGCWGAWLWEFSQHHTVSAQTLSTPRHLCFFPYVFIGLPFPSSLCYKYANSWQKSPVVQKQLISQWNKGCCLKKKLLDKFVRQQGSFPIDRHIVVTPSSGRGLSGLMRNWERWCCHCTTLGRTNSGFCYFCTLSYLQRYNFTFPAHEKSFYQFVFENSF